MKNIVEKLQEKRNIEVAKSILESNGYKVTKKSKRLKESAFKTYYIDFTIECDESSYNSDEYGDSFNLNLACACYDLCSTAIADIKSKDKSKDIEIDRYWGSAQACVGDSYVATMPVKCNKEDLDDLIKILKDYAGDRRMMRELSDGFVGIPMTLTDIYLYK